MNPKDSWFKIERNMFDLSLLFLAVQGSVKDFTPNSFFCAHNASFVWSEAGNAVDLVYLTWGSNFIRWYSSSKPRQCNDTGISYYYAGIY